MKKIIITLIMIALLGGSVVAFKSATQEKLQNHKISVVTSFYPLYFFTSELAGDNVNLTNITPPGVEPHDYEPTPRDVAQISNSQLLVLNGGGFEPWSADLDSKTIKILSTGEGLFSREIEEDGQKTKDPHVWLSPRLAKLQAKKILESLIAIDPDNEEGYNRRGQILFKKFDKLDRKFSEGLKTCVTRDFVTAHEAFYYLAQNYNLNQIGIAGISVDEEPSLQQLASVANFAKKNNIKYIFFETLVSPKLAETIANEVRAQTLVLDPLEGLSNEGVKAGKNYFTIMEDNLNNLRLALSCK